MRSLQCVIFLCLLVFVMGCKTLVKTPLQNDEESIGDVTTAVGSIAEAISGQDLTQEELDDFEKRLMHDKETQEVVGVITQTISSDQPIAKYCPVTGKRYAAKFDRCPEHNVELKPVN